MDRKLVNYKKYVKKLQTKLEDLGFKFKDKHLNDKNLALMKSKTMV